MTRPIAQNADPAFIAGGKGTFRLLDGEWRVWGAGIGDSSLNSTMTREGKPPGDRSELFTPR